MNDKPSREEGAKRPSDIDLSVDINPEMYRNPRRPSPTRERFEVYLAAEEATEEADNKVSAEAGGETKGFVTAKADGAMAGVYDWIKCIIFAISIVVICLTFLFRLVDVEGHSMNDTLVTKDTQ